MNKANILFTGIFFLMSNLLAVDLDNNGIEDLNEQVLANKFCPCLVLHAADQGVSPEPVEIMGIDSQELWMRVYNNSTGQCLYEKQVSEGGDFNPPVSSWHEALDFDKNYSNINFSLLSYVGTPPGASYAIYKFGIHYEYAGQGNDPSFWRSAYANEAINNNYKDRVYVNLWKKPDEANVFVVQYWFFYPFNDGTNKHEGDWEHINVQISSQNPLNAEIVKIDYYSHYNVIPDLIEPNVDFFVIDNTHPVVFVAGHTAFGQESGEGSHGSYPCIGRWPDINVLDIDEDVNGGGRYISYKEIETYVLPHNIDVIDYNQNKNLCWLKANIPWGHWHIDSKLAWIEYIGLNAHSTPPKGPYYSANGKAWKYTRTCDGEYDHYNNWCQYDPVTASGWSAPLVQKPPAPPMLVQVQRISTTQAELTWNNPSGTSGTKIYYSNDPRFDRFYEYVGTGLSEGNSPIIINSSTINTKVLNNLNAGPYYFALRSFNNNGTSWYSNEIDIGRCSGTLPYDQTWSGTHTLTGTITVPPGVTLTIESGTTVYIPSGNKITVNGTLIAEGEYGNLVRFYKTGAGNWYGIDFTSSSTDNAIQYCEFKNMSNGLVFNQCPQHITLFYCDFSFNQTALRPIGSEIQTQRCEFDFNSSYAVNCSNNASYFGLTHNIYSDNGTGIGGDYGSQLSLGVSGGGSYGYNSFYNLINDINSSYSGTVSAEMNWWGSSTPSPQVSYNVDWQPYLTEEPMYIMYPRGQKPQSLAKTVYDQRFSETHIDTTGIAEFDRLFLSYAQGDYEKSLSACLNLVQIYANTLAGQLALITAERCLRRLERTDETMTMLEQKSQLADAVSLTAKQLLSRYRVGRGEYQDALSLNQTLMASSEPSISALSLFELATIHWYYLGDRITGESLFRQFIALYPKHDLAASACVTLGEAIPSDELEKQAELPEYTLNESGTVPDKYCLYPNFPNPFNPATTIQYDIKKEGRVVIELFTIRGEKVRTLLDEHCKAGSFQLKVDFSGLSSGLYFYRMTCDEFCQIRKMTLVR